MTDIVFAAVVSGLFAWASLRLRWLTLSGAVCAGALGFSLLWLGDLCWILPLIAFFSTSVLLSKYRASPKERSDVRNAVQVLANGGVGWCLLLAHAVWPTDVLYVGFAASLAAATSDTWATEIGRLWGGAPRSIRTGQPVAKGESGGVSGWGTAGAAAGAVFIGGITTGFVGVWVGSIVAAAGLAGSVADSLLGASVQARFRDPETGNTTERPGGTVIRGWGWMSNDMVNVACTLVGGVGGAVGYALLG